MSAFLPVVQMTKMRSDCAAGLRKCDCGDDWEGGPLQHATHRQTGEGLAGMLCSLKVLLYLCEQDHSTASTEQCVGHSSAGTHGRQHTRLCAARHSWHAQVRSTTASSLHECPVFWACRWLCVHAGACPSGQADACCGIAATTYHDDRSHASIHSRSDPHLPHTCAAVAAGSSTAMVSMHAQIGGCPLIPAPEGARRCQLSAGPPCWVISLRGKVLTLLRWCAPQLP